ncbi:MAG: tetratricopeptide repeat protein, partial [Terriglobales bacterium]
KFDRVWPGGYMLSWIRISSALFLFAALLVLPSQAQNSEQLEVGPPPLHRADPPAPSATPEELEQRGDELRMEKNFLDAIDYYDAALKSTPTNASLFNKIGICQLMMQRYKEAKKSFERSIRADHDHADAYNNLGVTYYATHNFNGAIKHYEKAISIQNDAASYYSNLGTAYFGKKRFEKAIECYAKAVQLDPSIFDRSSHAGVQAKLPSPEDRAHYDYVLAKMFAKTGVNDRSLHYLKKAMEDGYKDIKNVYKDDEFAALRKDPRFAELMAAKTTSISN